MYGNYFSPFSLRISEELLNKIKSIARANSRSTNKEIEFILKQYVYQYEQNMERLGLSAEHLADTADSSDNKKG
ncbi:MAG: Arc family DNA-binding protein [Clostridia bacterium]|nr:Arc family DNA-binding protein [Clostridia bacterium]